MNVTALAGRSALVVALVLLVVTAVAGAAGAATGRRRLETLGRRCGFAAAGFVAVAAVALESAFVREDFSLGVVASYSSREMPLVYRMAAFWGSQPGSLLLWLLVLTGAASLVTYQNRHRNRELMPWVTAVLGAIMVFFATMAALVSSPFEHVAGAVPVNGTGLDP